MEERGRVRQACLPLNARRREENGERDGGREGEEGEEGERGKGARTRGERTGQEAMEEEGAFMAGSPAVERAPRRQSSWRLVRERAERMPVERRRARERVRRKSGSDALVK